ncbi:MAG: FtsX-like permease family protein [Candidatus Eremiobacteraeota bacterium]|nr:FtsX-like permease family protein [Candidatus Eremiobacteraeota bacterium]
MVVLARKNLFADLPRFIVALCAVIFAVTLLTVQTGIYNGFIWSTTLLIEESRADIWLAAKQILYLEITLPLTYGQLTRVRSVPGVARAEPIILRTALWRSPRDTLDATRVVGFDPAGRLFSPGNLAASDLRKLQRPFSFFADASQLDALDMQHVGERGTVGGLRGTLVQLTHGTQPIVSPTFLYTSLETANAYAPSALSFLTPSNDARPAPLTDSDSVTFILVAAKSRNNIQNLQGALERALPGTQALTRQEMLNQTRGYWLRRTSIGFALSLTALLGLIVGAVVVGQILYVSVSEHIKEYGTLRAIGAADPFLYGVIVRQALYMAVLGYIPSLILSLVISVIASHRGVAIQITPVTAAIVFVLTLAMCIIAAAFAMQRVVRVDPAVALRA